MSDLHLKPEEVQKEILLEEIKIINSSIVNLDKASTQVKQWCITIWIGAWGLIATNQIDIYPKWLFNFSTVIIPVIFLIVDLQVKRSQKKFIWRAMDIHGWLNNTSTEASGSREGFFRVYDPASANISRSDEEKKYSAKYQEFIDWKRAFFKSLTLKAFYILLIGVSLFGFFWITAISPCIQR